MFFVKKILLADVIKGTFSKEPLKAPEKGINGNERDKKNFPKLFSKFFSLILLYLITVSNLINFIRLIKRLSKRVSRI